MAEFCIHEKHGGICGKTGTYCNLGACPDEDLKEYAPVKRGRWIKESDGGTRCSVCNKRVRDVTGGWDEPGDLSDMPYCPKCGARMDEEAQNER